MPKATSLARIVWRGCTYQTARMHVSEGTYTRFGRYEPAEMVRKFVEVITKFAEMVIIFAEVIRKIVEMVTGRDGFGSRLVGLSVVCGAMVGWGVGLSVGCDGLVGRGVWLSVGCDGLVGRVVWLSVWCDGLVGRVVDVSVGCDGLVGWGVVVSVVDGEWMVYCPELS